jgi:N-acetyl-gamma-glutamyl-phosphate reductase
MTVSILGTTGYAGMVLLRIALGHHEVDRVYPVSGSRAGAEVSRFDPGIPADLAGERLGATNGTFCTIEDAVDAKPDVVFSALPHLSSAAALEPFLGNCVVIDLSADFRISDPSVFEAAYGQPPARPDLLSQAVYGLSEVERESVRTADLIANPGCYPTATLLPLIPIDRAGFVAGRIVTHAMSGISGAGRKNKLNLLFSERTENANAYAPGTSHRHHPEIQSRLGPSSRLLFTPHLVPLSQGMVVTSVVPVTSPAETAIRAVENAYEGMPFVRLRGEAIPETRDVRNTNRCDIGWRIESDTVLLFSVIDNLWKGAAGQAVQNMNIRFGFSEREGLNQVGEL